MALVNVGAKGSGGRGDLSVAFSFAFLALGPRRGQMASTGPPHLFAGPNRQRRNPLSGQNSSDFVVPGLRADVFVAV